MSEGRLMIVEDDTDISNMLRIYFQSQEYDVAVAQRGEDALEMCRQQLPHIIVLDIMLPDMDGYDVCRNLRGNLRTSHIPIIFLTQKDERSDKIHGLELVLMITSPSPLIWRSLNCGSRMPWLVPNTKA